MAVGLTPKYQEEMTIDNLTQQQFIVLAFEIAQYMGWQVNYLSDAGMMAYTNDSQNAAIKIIVENGRAKIQSSSTGSEMMDAGKNKKLVQDFIQNLTEKKSNIATEKLDEIYQVLKPQMTPEEADVLKPKNTSIPEKIKEFFSYFIPKEGFFVTPILININILIFISMLITGVDVMNPATESLITWGANFKPLTLDGEAWRLFTCMFLHIGIIHLLMNMYALFYIGMLLEPLLGKTRFLSAYLLTGIASSMTSLWWNDLTVSAGASGAIFGMFGVFLALLTTHLIDKNIRMPLLKSIGFFVVFNLVYGLKGNIDSAAHIGGLLSGVLIGYAFIPSLYKPNDKKFKNITVGLVSLLILTSSFIVYHKLPNDIGIYNSQMDKFIEMEAKALEVYNLPENSPDEIVLDEIKNKGIYYWKKNILLLDSLQNLDLSTEIRTRNRILKEYCELRIKSYELLYKAVSENTDIYQKQLELYNTQIEAKISELNGANK